MWKKTDISGMIKKCLFFCIFINFILFAAIGGRLYWFCMPSRMEAECRDYGIDVETLKMWEDQEAQGMLALAGWRFRERVMVSGVSTKRRQTAQVMEVYGNMELAAPARILSGTYGLLGREDTCVLTGELADALFGSVDVVGEQVSCLQTDVGWTHRKHAGASGNGTGQGKQAGAQDGSTNHILTVAGVIDKEGQCLLTFTQSGEIERVAVRFRERFQIKERMKELLSSGSQGAWGSITLFGSGFSSANARSDTSYRRSGN